MNRDNIRQIVRPFFFYYLVYGSADPIFQDLEEKKFCFCFLHIFSFDPKPG